MSAPSALTRYWTALQAEMRAAVVAPAAELNDFYGIMHYHLGWVDERFRPIDNHTGKQLRPLFCLLTCEACGGRQSLALPVAAAIELLHNFSLIHDDIEDADSTRRGRPTAWTVWGMPQALNAGDALHSLAQLTLLRLSERGAPAETVVEALRLFEEACLQLTEGQFLDLRFESEEDISTTSYLGMVAKKTAALLAASCRLGALVAQAPERQQERLQHFGHHLGLAFQIQDDVLGIWGDPAVTGKPVGADLRRRKKTLPVLYALRHCEPFRALLAQPELTAADVARAVEWMEASGSRAYADEQARLHTDQALAALDQAGISGPAADALHDLALELLGRSR